MILLRSKTKRFKNWIVNKKIKSRKEVFLKKFTRIKRNSFFFKKKKWWFLYIIIII